MTIICIVILAGWFLISLAAQMNARPVAYLRARDIFSLIPNWSFFAPRPGTSDYHLVFRDSDESGEWSRWREIPLNEKRTLWGAIWNPQKRLTRSFGGVRAHSRPGIGGKARQRTSRHPQKALVRNS